MKITCVCVASFLTLFLAGPKAVVLGGAGFGLFSVVIDKIFNR